MPRTRWAHNYPPPSGPVWLRPSGERMRVRAALWWGEPFQGSLDVACDEMGVLLTAPVSIPTPPIEVVFDGEGWADFGVGTVPDEVNAALRILARDGRDILGTSAPVDPPPRPREQRALARLLISLRSLVEDLGIAWSVLVPHLGMARSDRASQSLGGQSVGAETAIGGLRLLDDFGSLRTQLLINGAQTRALREARGLSREAVAREVTALNPRLPVRPTTIEALEHSAALGRVPDLIARLDTVYGADGRVGVQQIFNSADGSRPVLVRGPTLTTRITFPHYWVGPVWVQVTSGEPGERGVVDLLWVSGGASSACVPEPC